MCCSERHDCAMFGEHAQSVQCAHDMTTFWTCWLTDRRFEIVTPRIFMVETRAMSGNGGGRSSWRRRLWLVKIISTDFERLSVILFARAHVSMLINSTVRVLLLSGGIIKYVSSAYLQSRLPSVTACRSPAVTLTSSSAMAERPHEAW